MSAQLEVARLQRGRTDWPMFRLKHLARLMGGGTPSKENAAYWEEGDIPWVSPKDMKRRLITKTEDYITAAAVNGSATSFVEAGSPLVVVRSGILKHTLPVAMAGVRLTLNQDMKAFRLRPELDAAFFAYWIEGQSAELLLEWRQLGATVESIDTDRMMNGRIAVPDLATQKTIADFLDRETVRIDQLIEKKQQLVGLINEKRSVETDHVIFGQVDAGFIPSSKIKFLARRISKGTTPSTLGAEIVTDGVRFLRAENIWFGIVTDSPQHFISDETHQLMARSALEPNDVLVVIAGATTGKAAVIREDQTPANSNQAISYIRLWHPYLAPVVSAAIQTKRVQQEILLTSVQSAQPNLAMEDLGNLKVPAPRKEDAVAIIEKLEKANAKYRSLTDRVSKSANMLQELRSALITAAVTGQIDVTTWGRRGETDRRLERIEEEMSAPRGVGEVAGQAG